MHCRLHQQCRQLLLSQTRFISPAVTQTADTKLMVNTGPSNAHDKCHTHTISRFIATSGARRSSSNIISPDHIVRSPRPDIAIPTNVTFHEYIFAKCDMYKDLTALSEFLTGRAYTYSQVKENSIRVASALHRLGYRKGDVVLSFTSNQIDVCILMLACASLGICYSAANPTFTSDELAQQLTSSGCLAVFTIPQLAGTVNDALRNKNFPHKVKQTFVFGKSPGLQPFQSLLDDDGKGFPDVEINPMEDVFALPYSSGTTGLPKGVMLTHYSILANCLQMDDAIKVETGERSLGLLPLYHIFGMVVVQYMAFQKGAHLIIMPKFEPESFLKCIQDAKIELANLVPSIISFLAKHPLVDKFDLRSLRRIFSAAAPLGKDQTVEFLQRFTHGVTLAQGYGLTETSPATNVDCTTKLIGSIGTMVANTLGKIVDLQTNKALGPGEQGEFCVKGPQIMKGYLNNQQATDHIITPDGWLHTGDIGYYTEDGSFYICDRLKELIKYKGSQVPPAELEALLLGHRDVADVAVVGVPDERAGELARAFVVRKPGRNVDENTIINFVKDKMAPSKWLHGGVQFINEIPRNASGKILRRNIKEKYVTTKCV